MTNHYETTIQVAKTSTGGEKFWKGIAFQDENGCWTQSETWQQKGGRETKHITSAPNRSTAKSQPTDWDQAVFDVKSELAKKQKKGYWPLGEAAPARRPLPMLAHEFDERKHDIAWPAFVQPKLDGMRLLFDGKTGWSREGNELAPEILAHIQVETGGVILDGEFILPQPYTFQDTVGAAKAFDPELSPQLEYHVYDVVDTTGTKTFQERSAALSRLVEELGHRHVRLVPTVAAVDEDEVVRLHDGFVGVGFEGAIIRNAKGTYAAGHRSKDLQKLKRMTDTEFEIVGVTQGNGKDAGTAKFICKTKTGATFRVRPQGTLGQRRKMWTDRESLVGKFLTVQHQGYTDDGLPRCVSGKTVRDYE